MFFDVFLIGMLERILCLLLLLLNQRNEVNKLKHFIELEKKNVFIVYCYSFLLSLIVFKTSSASSLVLTLISIGTGSLESCFGSIGGFGTQTIITLFLPTREAGIVAVRNMFSRMLPEIPKKKKIIDS